LNPSGRRLLDIGTCCGQDLRILRQSGAPPGSLYGTDLFPAFESIGHSLFCDADTFSNQFFAANVLSDDPNNPLSTTQGLWDVVTATMMLHQFNLDEQKIIAARMIRLLKPTKGSMILGSNTGQLEAAALIMKPPFVKEGEERWVYRQSKESMAELWWEAIDGLGEEGEKTKTRTKWRVECDYDLKQHAARERERKEKGEVRYFQGDGQRRILYSVTRIE
jgi:hypothetical protein